MLNHKQQADNWSCYSCAYDLATVDSAPAYLPIQGILVLNIHTHNGIIFFYSFSHSDSCPHMRTHTQAFTQQSSQARLLWLKIRGGIINHKSLPLVKSSLSWCEQSAMPAEQRQVLSGWWARGAGWGLSRHPEAYQSRLLMDGRTMIRTRLWLRKANRDPASIGDRFLCSSFHPAVK